jgi:hypothetical protein
MGSLTRMTPWCTVRTVNSSENVYIVRYAGRAPSYTPEASQRLGGGRGRGHAQVRDFVRAGSLSCPDRDELGLRASRVEL